MTNKTKSSLLTVCDDDVNICFVDHENKRIFLNEDNSPDLVIFFDDLLKKQYEVVYLLSSEKCPFCSLGLNKNGTDEFLLNKVRKIRIQKYVCKNKNCKSYIRASLEKFVDKHCNFTKSVRELGLKIASIDHISYEKKAELIELTTGAKIERSTVCYHEKTLADDYLAKKEKEIARMIKKLGIEPNGVYHYDEQVLWINTDLKLRMTIIDASNNLIINEKVINSEEFDKNTIKNFLKRSLEGLKLEAIITDRYQAYPSIIEALGAIQQKCVFHKMQTLMKKVNKNIRRLNRKIKRNEEKIEKSKTKIKEL